MLGFRRSNTITTIATGARTRVNGSMFPGVRRLFRSSYQCHLSYMFIVPLTGLHITTTMVFLRFRGFSRLLRLLQGRRFPVLRAITRRFPGGFLFKGPRFGLTILRVAPDTMRNDTINVTTTLIRRRDNVRYACSSNNTNRLIRQVTITLFTRIVRRRGASVRLIHRLFWCPCFLVIIYMENISTIITRSLGNVRSGGGHIKVLFRGVPCLFTRAIKRHSNENDGGHVKQRFINSTGRAILRTTRNILRTGMRHYSSNYFRFPRQFTLYGARARIRRPPQFASF